MIEFQRALYANPPDGEEIGNLMKELQSHFTIDEINHELESAITMNYELIPIVKPYLQLPFNISNISNKDPIFYIKLYQAGLVQLREIIGKFEVESLAIRYSFQDELFQKPITSYFAKELGETVSPDFEIQRLCHFSGPIAAAILQDNIDEIQLLSTAPNFNVNQFLPIPSQFGQFSQISLLSYAALCKSLKIFKFLLLNGADPNLVTEMKRNSSDQPWSVIDCCAASGAISFMKYIEEAGVNITSSIFIPATIFHQNEILDWIFQSKVPLLKENVEKLLPIAIKYNNLHIISTCLRSFPTYLQDLVTQKLQISPNNTSLKRINVDLEPLWIALSNGHEQAAQILFQYNADSSIHDGSGNTLIHLAAESGCTKSLEKLISLGQKVNIMNSRYQTPLHLSAKNGHVEATKFLLAKGLDPYFQDNTKTTPFGYAAENGHCSVAKTIIEFLQRKFDNSESALKAIHEIISMQNEQKMNPLVMATKNGKFEMMKLLIQYGDENYVNIKCSNGLWTALHYAAGQGYIEGVQILLEKHANPNIVDYLNRAPIHYAAMHSFPSTTQCIQILVQNGADPNLSDQNGWTPIGITTGHKDIKAAEILISAGANPNTFMKGKTPLHWAAIAKDQNMVYKLLEVGADQNAKDDVGKTFHDYLPKKKMNSD